MSKYVLVVTRITAMIVLVRDPYGVWSSGDGDMDASLFM
jgi:hypothetical protein